MPLNPLNGTFKVYNYLKFFFKFNTQLFYSATIHKASGSPFRGRRGH